MRETVREATSTTTAPDAARAALALAALRKAEQRTGARPVLSHRTAHARAVAGPAGSAGVAGSSQVPPPREVNVAERAPLAVLPQLVELLPQGIRRGSVLQVLGSTALLLEMLAAATTHTEEWIAVVGQPHIGILAAHEAGVDLSRLILVPEPGPEAVTALAALLDGVGILVIGPGATLLPADRRRLTARARERGTVIFATAPWAGANVELAVTGVRWRGFGPGIGRLLNRELTVERTGRGDAARKARVEVVLPSGALTGTTPTDVPAPSGATELRLVG